MLHQLKSVGSSYQDIASGKKKFDFRKNDRDYHVGDRIVLKEYSALTGNYTGRETLAHVTYIQPGGMFGIPEEYCILGIEVKVVNNAGTVAR